MALHLAASERNSRLTASVIIRDATDEDRPALARLMQGLNRFEDAITGDRLTDADSAAKHVSYLEDVVMDDGGCVLVAEYGGAVVGFLVAFIEEDDGHYLKPEARKHGYISDLFVEDAARSKGVAHALMTEAECLFGEMGIKKMQIGVLAANDGARVVYEKAGYQARSVFLEKDI